MNQLTFNDLVVLLVEPSLAQRHIIGNLLRELNINHLLGAANGQDALAQMAKEPPDLVISSLYLPDMQGTDLVVAMKQDPKLESVAFVLISSETRFHMLDPVRQAGAVAIIPKPFGTRELKTALQTTLEHLNPVQADWEDVDPDSLRVLLVDDSVLARKSIRRVLDNLGIENITEAVDGLEALRLIREQYFDLVVTDYNMPRMDGKELVDQIRSASGQASVPILMVTSERDAGRLAAIQQAGVSAVCDKPFEPSFVRGLLGQILRPD